MHYAKKKTMLIFNILYQYIIKYKFTKFFFILMSAYALEFIIQFIISVGTPRNIVGNL